MADMNITVRAIVPKGLVLDMAKLRRER